MMIGTSLHSRPGMRVCSTKYSAYHSFGLYLVFKKGVICKQSNHHQRETHSLGLPRRFFAAATSTDAATATSFPVNAQDQKQHAALWGSSKHVHVIGVEEAEELYLSLVQRTNEQHILMVLYAPWCTHCQQMEQEIDKLASGLSYESSLSVVALNCDPAAARFFSKDVLGISTLPSFVLFPKESRTFYKYKGKGRDAPSLLKFLNMVCNQSRDHVWQLGGLGTATGAASRGILASLPAQVHTSVTANPGLSVTAAVVLAAAVYGVVKVATAKPAEDAAEAGQDGQGAVLTTTSLSRRIDATMQRMSQLMMRLAGARISLGLMSASMKAMGIDERALSAPSNTDVAALPAAAATVETAEAAPVLLVQEATTVTETKASVSGKSPSPAPVTDIVVAQDTGKQASASPAPRQASPSAAVSEKSPSPVREAVTASQQSASPAPFEAQSSPQPAAMRTPSPSTASSPVPQTVSAAAAAAPESTPAARTSPSPGTAAEQTVASNIVPLAAAVPAAEAAVAAVPAGEVLSASEVLRLLDEEGDVDKVVQKLLERNVTLESLPRKL